MVKLYRRNEHLVNINLDGYTPYEITLHRNISGWFLGNILLGGIIGIAVDAVTGAIYTFSPKNIYGDLNAASTSSKKTEKELYVTVVLEPDAEWNKVGQLEAFISGTLLTAIPANVTMMKGCLYSDSR